MTACTLTGIYPEFWRGIRYDRAVNAWAVAKSLKMSRDISQAKLIGGLGELWGTGMIPKHLLVGDPIMSRGEDGAVDTIKVRHVSGGISTCRFPSYDAGRESLQGATLDWAWMDEEPADLEVYSEILARLSARPDGRLIITFTPLLGMSGISIRYRQEQSPDRAFVQMGIDDVPPAKDDFDESGGTLNGTPPVYGHIPLSEREKIVEGFPAHERDARSRGEPMLGEGRVYTAPEGSGDGSVGIVEIENHHTWPNYWRWGWGWDPGGGTHPAGATLNCFDPDQGVFHVVAELRMSDATIGQFAAQMRQVEKTLFNSTGMQIPIAWPADAGTRDKQSMTSWVKLMVQENRRMMNEPASLPGISGQAKFSLEGGVAEIDKWERTGKWKVHARCRAYLEERRLYHRKDGEIVRLRDDVLSSARYAWAMRRKFLPLDVCLGVPDPIIGPGGQRRSDPRQRFARGSSHHPGGSYDIFSV